MHKINLATHQLLGALYCCILPDFAFIIKCILFCLFVTYFNVPTNSCILLAVAAQKLHLLTVKSQFIDSNIVFKL